MTAALLNALALITVIAFALWRYQVNLGELSSVFAKDLRVDVPTDLQVYLLGGQRVAEGQPLYDGDLLPGLPFTYPPFAGVVFSWLGEPRPALGIAWTVASMVVLGWVVWESSKSKQIFSVAVLTAFFVLCTEPVHATLYFGQVNVFLMALVCMDFLPKNRWMGVGTGLAAGLKLTPAFFLVLFAVKRQWGAVFVAAFTFLCTVATGFAEVTDAGRFWTESMFNSDRVGFADNPGAQAIRQVLERQFGVESTAVWLALAAFVTVLAGAAAHFALRRSEPALAVAFIGMASCLVSPFSWHHHWVWIVPFGVVIYQWWGALALIVIMVPYTALNITHGLVQVPDLLFTTVPVAFMAGFVAYELAKRAGAGTPRRA